MANLSADQLSMLQSLGYEPAGEDSDQRRFKNKDARAEIVVVDVGGQLHFDFSGYNMLGERTAMDDLIFSEDLVKRLTEESVGGHELASSAPSPGE